MATILCVEDEDALREDIVEELTDEGYQVLSARNGAEGLKIISENSTVDLVLSDITMPIMDGFEFLKQVREHEGNFADIPFVFLSALTDSKQIVEGKVLGADDYVVKPVDFDLLFATISARVRQVERMKQRREKDMVALYKALSQDEESPDQMKSNLPPSTEPLSEVQPTKSVEASSLPPTLPNTGKLVTGRFQLLGLEGIKEKLGDKLDSHMSMIKTVMQNVVYKNLGPQDVCKAAENGDMMICFSTLTQREAAYKLEAINKEIWVRVLGEEEYMEGLHINPQAFEIEVEEEEYNEAPDPWEIIQNRIDKAAAAAQERVDTFVQDILERAEVRFTKFQKPTGEPLPISVSTFDNFGLRKLKNITQVIDKSDQRCLVIEGGYIGQTVAYMIASLADMAAAGVVMNISYPLCINKREFENTLAVLEKLTPKAKERLIIAITDIPKQLHLAQLTDLMMRLRPFSKMRMTEFQIEMPTDPGFEMAGVSILMLDYYEATALLKHSRARFLKAIKILKQKKKKLLITNTPPEKSKSCRNLGADFVLLKNIGP
ncbi:MAG: response regulator [Halopseudomonas aestusnigri]